MIKPLVKSVKKFMEACDQPVRKPVGIPTREEMDLRVDMLAEEVSELLTAENVLYGEADDAESRAAALVEVADALGDIIYVVVGTALTYGIDLDKVLKEICRSNESKISDNGEVLKNAAGKVMKPEGYTPPNLYPIVFPEVKVK